MAQHSTAQQRTDSDRKSHVASAMYAGRTGDSHHNTDRLPLKSKISPPPFSKSNLHNLSLLVIAGSL